MSILRCGLGALVLVLGCAPIDPAQNTLPPPASPMTGPPGGGMDPGDGYAPPAPVQAQVVAYDGPDQPGYPQGYPPGYPDGTASAPDAPAMAPEVEPSPDPQDPGYDLGQVNDAEIDATLDGYGTWEETEDYGRVWHPDPTAVGVGFTPYETAGSWIWSDAGWNFSCDYNWGWLPFHYGRWGWFGDSWGWQPGYAWSAGAVEWRGGGGYTGWRPLAPIVRDHRGDDHGAPTIRDHRRGVIARDSQWRFTRDGDFGKGHIRGHLFQNPAEGLRATSIVARPAIAANYAPVSSASLMRSRLGSGEQRSLAGRTGFSRGGARPGGPPEVRGGTAFGGYRGPSPAIRNQPLRGDTPTWRRPAPGAYQAPQGAYQTPYRAQPTYRAPQPAYRAPPPTYRAPQPTYRAPQQAYRPSYRPPAAPSTWSRPSGGGYQHPSYAPPASSGGSFHSSAPSHASGGGGGSFHSSGGGGGGRHR